MFDPHSVIAAVSTPPGKGGVALIRVSGEGALAVASRVFRPKRGTLAEHPPRLAIYGDIWDGDTVVDDGLAIRFEQGRSYTGEETVEICCHGGILLTRTILEALFLAGARPAEAGEFTRRAYLNGNLSLSEAEAIGALLEAKSHAQIRLGAARSLLSKELGELRQETLTLAGAAEAVIDFPEEDLSELSPEDLLLRLCVLEGRLSSLLATWRTGRAVSEGIETAIVGRPNVGKSTLYNLLLGEEAAIVSPYEGTTRDILEKTVPLGRVLLHLKDTAGIRESLDPIEQIGVKRADEALESASLLLFVLDASAPLTEEDLSLCDRIAALSTPTVLLLNKADLPERIEREALSARFPYMISLSATEKLPDELSLLVDRLFTDGSLELGETAILSTARQNAALLKAHEAIRRAITALKEGYPADMVTTDMEGALAALSECDGESASREIVAEIFSHFCVGK